MAKQVKAEQLPDISQSLEQLGETTTAAELVRTQGQSKKLRVISEKKLMTWILALLNQHMAGKADSFSDQEKEELLKKTQDELAKRIKREQDAQGERERLKAELDKAMAKVSEAKAGQLDAEQLNEALSLLKTKLEEAEQINQDMQQDNYDLHDQLNEKMALLSSTIAEKEKLRTTVRNQLVRSNALVEGVLGLDTSLYGSRHQDENPPSEEGDDAVEESQFYHDFEVGAKVIDTLSTDLQRMRSIAQSAQDKDAARANDPRMNLLEGDLQLLEQLKEGSLHAVDVAEPVEGLVEAVEGARAEAQELERVGAAALGAAGGREDVLSTVPDASGEAAEVLAGTTSVVRELAASLARAKSRLTALKEMSDQADEARNTSELELEQTKTAYQQVLAALAARAKADKQKVSPALVSEDAPTEESSAKAIEVIGKLRGGSAPETKQILSDHLMLVDRLLGEESGMRVAPPPADAEDSVLMERLNADSAALERLVREHKSELAAAHGREQALAEQVRALARARSKSVKAEFGSEAQPLDVGLKQLDQALSESDNPAAAADAAKLVIAALADEAARGPSITDLKRLDDERTRLASQVGQAQQKIAALESDLDRARGELGAVSSQGETRRRTERDVAAELVRAAKGDEQLADSTADLALAVDGNGEDLSAPLREAVTSLARRKHDLSEENDRIKTELAAVRTQADEAGKRSTSLSGEQQRLTLQLSQAQQRLQDLDRDLGRGRTDLDALRTQLADSSAKRTAAESERSKLAAQASASDEKLREAESMLNKAREELTAAKTALRSRRESDAQIADVLGRVAQGDPDLTEIANAEFAGDEAASQQAAKAVEVLAARKQELAATVERMQRDGDALKWQIKEANDRCVTMEGERDEMALNGKEVIAALTQQRERTVQELEQIKRANSDAEQQLNRFQSRVIAAETANRQLAESLSALAAAEKDQGATGVEDKRVDLELALSQLPDEGEDAVSIPEDLSLQLASSGQKLAEALLQRRQQITSTFQRGQQDNASLKIQLDKLKTEAAAAQTALEDQESSLRSSQAEVKAVRQEMANQGRDLAQKVQELTSARGEFASAKAELAVAQNRVEDLDRRSQQNASKLADIRREQEQLQSQLAEAQGKADAHAHAQSQLVQALRSLTNRQDASPELARALTDPDLSDPLSKAAQKLDLAQASGPEQLAIAGQAYVHALHDRVQLLAQGLEETRGQLGATKASEDHLNSELAALRASVVDRDHQIENLAKGMERAKAEQAELINQIMENRRAHDGTAATLKQLQEQLRQAQAEVAEYQARDGASSGHFSSDNDRLRQELEAERKAREEIEAKIADLSERVESGDSRLKAQRDEFTRRLEERDSVIHQKDRQLDNLAAQRSDAKSLEAQLAALSKDLAGANDRIKELEGAHGAHAGASVKTSDLARELKNVQSERDQLREKSRQIEADLTDAVSLSASLKTQLDEKRKGGDGAREKLHKELAEEREKGNALRDEFRKLKEEVVGLRARIRRLTDPSGGTGSGGTGVHKLS